MDRPIPEAVRRAIYSNDLYQVLMDVQNGIDSPGLCGMANSAIRRIDSARDAITAAQQPDHIVDAALTAAQQQGQGGGDVVAWLANDGTGRVIDAKAKAAAARAGGATASAMAAYTIPLAPPSAPVGVEALRAEQAAAVMPLIGPLLDAWERVHPDDSVHDSGIAKYIEPINRAMEDGIAPSAPYSIDADADGIRARVADAITGALAFGAQGAHKPPAGHWLEPFWDMARAEREAPSPPTVGEATARRLDDYLGGEFDIRIGKQAAHAALVHALAQQPAAVDEAHVGFCEGHCSRCDEHLAGQQQENGNG